MAQAARAERVALLPLEGSGLLSRTRDDLDRELREALAKRGLEVQPRDATVAQLDEAQSAGLNCPTLTDECARRVGLVAEVDTVYRASVELFENDMLLKVSRIDVHDAKAVPRRVAGRLVLSAIDDGKSLRAIVQRAVTGAGEATPVPVEIRVTPAEAELFLDGKRVDAGVHWLQPGPHAVRAQAPDHTDLHSDLEVHADGEDNEIALAMTPVVVEVPVMRYVGLGLVGVGALAVLGGGAAAGVLEWRLSSPQQLTQREQGQLLGRGALVTSAVGAGALAIGGVFAVVGGGE